MLRRCTDAARRALRAYFTLLRKLSPVLSGVLFACGIVIITYLALVAYVVASPLLAPESARARTLIDLATTFMLSGFVSSWAHVVACDSGYVERPSSLSHAPKRARDAHTLAAAVELDVELGFVSSAVLGDGDAALETRWCATCEVPKAPATHHCRACDRCVEEMDHHCPWIGRCVGRVNHARFLALLVHVCAASIYAWLLLGTASRAVPNALALAEIAHALGRSPALVAAHAWQARIASHAAFLCAASFGALVAWFHYLAALGCTTLEFAVALRVRGVRAFVRPSGGGFRRFVPDARVYIFWYDYWRTLVRPLVTVGARGRAIVQHV